MNRSNKTFIENIVNCLFCSIAEGKIPATVVFEDETIMAFCDVNPQAPHHLLVIPKKHIATIDDANTDDALLLGLMVLRAQSLAATEGFNYSGYRLVFNVNSNGGQTVNHIHLHVLGGRKMTWPPG